MNHSMNVINNSTLIMPKYLPRALFRRFFLNLFMLIPMPKEKNITSTNGMTRNNANLMMESIVNGLSL